MFEAPTQRSRQNIRNREKRDTKPAERKGHTMTRLSLSVGVCVCVKNSFTLELNWLIISSLTAACHRPSHHLQHTRANAHTYSKRSSGPFPRITVVNATQFMALLNVMGRFHLRNLTRGQKTFLGTIKQKPKNWVPDLGTSQVLISIERNQHMSGHNIWKMREDEVFDDLLWSQLFTLNLNMWIQRWQTDVANIGASSAIRIMQTQHFKRVKSKIRHSPTPWRPQRRIHHHTATHSPTVVADSSQTTLRRMREKVSIMRPAAVCFRDKTLNARQKYKSQCDKKRPKSCLFPLNS